MMCPETGTGVVVLVNHNCAADPARLCVRIEDWALSGNSTGNKATRVVLAEGSLGTAGDNCITGIKPGKYYTVETGTDELKKTGLATPLYVRADGTLTDQLKQTDPFARHRNRLFCSSMYFEWSNIYGHCLGHHADR